MVFFMGCRMFLFVCVVILWGVLSCCVFFCVFGVFLVGVFSVKNDEIGKYGVKNLGVCLKFLYICGVMVCLMGRLGVFVRFFGE